MASETVTIYCKDEVTPTPNLVDGVLIRVFDDAGDVFITQDTTGNVITGAVEFTLDGDDPPITYTIRMSKTGMAFDGSLGDQSKSPQSIDIYSPASQSPTGTNDFDVYGETFALPTATDPDMCRCSGYFLHTNSQPYTDLRINIYNIFNPTTVNNRAIIGGRIDIEPDSTGFVEVDLYREGQYKVIASGIDTLPRIIYVPDASSANLVNLMFPVVSQVTYAPSSVSVAVDGTDTVVTTVYSSDGRTLTGTASDDVTYTVADEDVASVLAGSDDLTITGISSGSTTLTATRTNTSILPDDGITQTPLSITVT
jgi:hypothetical protein